MRYIVEFENGGSPFWLAPWDGDPGRTVLKENARVFSNREGAEKALKAAKKQYPERKLKGAVVLV